MKHIYKSIILVLSIVFVGCSDFLDKESLTQPDSEKFLTGHAQVETYINGLYISLPALPKFGMGVRGEDINSDNILAEEYDKRLNGELSVFDGASDWKTAYERLRDANYFFEYYKVPENQETADVLSLKGEAYFFRAYWHFNLLTKFGNVPVMDAFWDDRATLEGMQISAKDRTEVAKFILEDLQRAEELLHPRSKFKGLRISKEASLILAMRVALYEGTWQKYHKGTDFDAVSNQSNYFLEEVLKCGDRLFALNSLKLNVKGGESGASSEEAAYGDLFNKKDLSEITEATFWKKYSNASGTFHALSGLLGAGGTYSGGPAGLPRDLIDNYLNTDGSFINPKDDIYKDFNATFANRDARLTATVMSSNKKFKAIESGSKPLLVKEYNEVEKDVINPPYLLGDGNGRNVTGFHIRLSVDETFVNGNGDTALALIRFSEALLCYAEAAEELNKCDDAVLEKTIKLLRERAGVTYVKPNAIDPNFSDFGYTLSANMQEIRRERRSELALQAFRFDDLMRWRGHKVFQAKRGKGAYLGKDGVLYKSFSEKQVDGLKKVLVDGDGWMDPLQQYLPGGYQFKENRDYLLPISPAELALNKKLHQNPSWN